MGTSKHSRTVPGPGWLKEAVFYQIYPQSFHDSNRDGIGDLPGIIAKLDYVASLGVNAIWLNPVFASPFADAGYDITDHCRVAPRYGCNGDLERLFAEAHRRGLRVVLDLVAGHTSIEHPWFKESMRAVPNEYSHRYLWTDRVWRQAPPPLQSLSGLGERNGSAIINFFWCQPALNYGYADPDPTHPWEKPLEHPDCVATREALREVMRFWLDRGADGFRVDMAPSIVRGHDPSKRRSALARWWRDIRQWLDRDYPEAVLISEWSYPKHAIAAGFHVDFMIHFETPAYNSLFRNHRPELVSSLPGGESFFDRGGTGDIRTFLDIYRVHRRATRGRGYISVPTGNHDTPPRLADGRNADELRCALLFLLTLPGIPFLYYGDEIGLRQAVDLPSKEGGYERTRVRTPMQWDDTANAGFSTAEAQALYLPVETVPGTRTVAAAERDDGSILHFVRRLIAWRRMHPALGADGAFVPVFAESKRSPFVYERRMGQERFWIAVNPSGSAVCVEIPRRIRPGLMLIEKGVELSITPRSVCLKLTAGGHMLFRVGASG